MVAVYGDTKQQTQPSTLQNSAVETTSQGGNVVDEIFSAQQGLASEIEQVQESSECVDSCIRDVILGTGLISDVTTADEGKTTRIIMKK